MQSFSGSVPTFIIVIIQTIDNTQDLVGKNTIGIYLNNQSFMFITNSINYLNFRYFSKCDGKLNKRDLCDVYQLKLSLPVQPCNSAPACTCIEPLVRDTTSYNCSHPMYPDRQMSHLSARSTKIKNILNSFI